MQQRGERRAEEGRKGRESMRGIDRERERTNQSDKIIYVDSGSTDESVVYAGNQDVEVLQLDMSIPFSAARARNEGFFFLLMKYPDLQYIQFIDGDCELDLSWLTTAVEFLNTNVSYAITAGRRKEQYPERSIYNQLCDIEWNTPVGETKASGGDFLVRVTAFQEVNGFNSSVIAGEEPELCYRLRQKGWRIYRINHLMTMHDAAITKFSQWWRRAIRSGHAYAHVAFLHRRDEECYQFKDCLRIWVWGLLIPVLLVVAAFLHTLFIPLIPVLYFIQFLRIYRGGKKSIKNVKIAMWNAWFLLIIKFPQVWGQIIFFSKQITNRKPEIIEYKK